MKKTVIFAMSALFICSGAEYVFAAPGDIAGQYYSTDIRTTLNGEEIDSINIGGKTLISAEDMIYYSFSVYWNPDVRTLEIYSVSHALNGAPPAVEKNDYPSGTVMGNYYDTDIITYLDGQPITAYNIGGRTYILAEQMRDFGYEVIWDEIERTLDIVSPDRAGYEYTIPMTFDEAVTEESKGYFSVLYQDGKLYGSGDVKYFSSSLSYDGEQYSINMGFYQNAGLFKSNALREKLNTFRSSGYGVESDTDPSLKYDTINEKVKISINGEPANNIEVIGGAGNGHVDYYFKLNGISRYKEDEIKSISFSLDGNENEEKQEIEYPDYYRTSIDGISDMLVKNENDYIETTYQTEEYIAVVFCESPSLGVVKEHLYLIKEADMTISSDILDEVRKIDGYNYDILNPFSFKVGDIKNNLFFSCQSEEKTGDFYVEMDSGTVHLLADHYN